MLAAFKVQFRACSSGCSVVQCIAVECSAVQCRILCAVQRLTSEVEYSAVQWPEHIVSLDVISRGRDGAKLWLSLHAW